ncbi:MAG: hypothetical protein WBD69_12955, partial [Candidatus Cybelea sp.]
LFAASLGWIIALALWLHGGITVAGAKATNPAILTAFSPIGLGFDLSESGKPPASTYQRVQVIAQNPADKVSPSLSDPTTATDHDWCEVLRIHNGQIGVSVSGKVAYYPTSTATGNDIRIFVASSYC